jgi:hypothetical protein
MVREERKTNHQQQRADRTHPHSDTVVDDVPAAERRSTTRSTVE